MADYRRHYEERSHRFERGGPDRAGHESRDYTAHHDEWRAAPDAAREDRASRWEGPREARADSSYDHAGASTGAYRTDDRSYHDRYRADRYRDDEPASRYRDEVRYGAADNARPRRDLYDAAGDITAPPANSRDDFMRWEAQSPGAPWEDGEGSADDSAVPWAPRERGGYWRQDQMLRPHFSGRGPKDYQRSDERVREEICDSMTDDPMLDASEIVVVVASGEVTLSGAVMSRAQKRRAEDVAERVSGVKDVTNQLRVIREANGHAQTASQPVSQASGKGTPSKSTSGTSA